VNERSRLTRGLMVLLTVFIFATAGTIHFQTPLLAEFGREFGADAGEVGWVATLTFGGFLAGTLFLAPLGDIADKRQLILAKLAGLIAGMLAMAAAPTLPVLAAAGFVTGVCAAVSQQIVPLVAELAAPGERGRAVGTVLSGLFLGILLGRVGGGLVGSAFGWRWTYVMSAAMLVAVAPVMIARLPRAPPKAHLAYGALLGSLVRLLRGSAGLRRACAVQFLLGICYGGFWSTLAQMMVSLHGLGPASAGLIGIPGAAGVLVARPAGRLADRRGVRGVVTAGICLVLAAYLTFGLAVLSVAAVVVGAILQDFGLRAAMVANQTLVTGADPETRSRANTVFALHVWGGNATGAFIASTAWTHAGWLGVCASGVVAALVALIAYRYQPARPVTPTPEKGAVGSSELHETTRGGERVLIRRVQPGDMALYPDFLADVSAEDLRLRFFARVTELSAEEIDKLTHLDYRHETAFIALDENTGHMLGLVRLKDELDEKTAEFAILVRSGLKGHGLGWLLMRRVIDHAKEKGLRRVYGDVLAENTTMLQMCAELGFHAEGSGSDIKRVVLDLESISG